MYKPSLLLLLFAQIRSPIMAERQCSKLDAQLADFGMQLLRCCGGHTSAVISPASAAVALAMLYAGAMNETKREINNVLSGGCEDESVFNYYSNVLQRISSASANYAFRSANRIHISKSIVLQNAFIETMRKKFNGEFRMVDFEKPKETAKAINEWLKMETGGKIEKVIDEEGPNLSDLLVINAIFFNGKWKFPFKRWRTLKEKFYPKEGQRMLINTMSAIEQFAYAEDELVEVVVLPYRNDDASLYIFLPKMKFALRQMENSLDGSKLLALINACRKSGSTEVRLPKFAIKLDFAVTEALRAIGIRRAFSRAEANFTGICVRPTYISNFIHKAFIEVNEGGTQASAVSALNMVFKSGRRIQRAFIANHPFMFAIAKNETIFFIGHFIK
ncbi:putative serpin-like protein [Toxocara canis]|uniref:Putative serpin-like protein n=1 Tax=Toxocara canis TaxID=6265 RepID=A0A0B2UMU3_TOXCA|nr:putative serpin-like protein [Toxocara canis]